MATTAEAGLVQSDLIQGVCDRQPQGAVVGRQGKNVTRSGKRTVDQSDRVLVGIQRSLDEGKPELVGQRSRDGYLVHITPRHQDVPQSGGRAVLFRQGGLEVSGPEASGVHKELPEGLGSSLHGGVWSARPGK